MEIDRLFNVHGKVALVSGGSRGIGFMIAEGFVANGCRTFIVARSSEACRRAAEHLNAKYGGGKDDEWHRCVPLVADLSRKDGINQAIDEFKSHEPQGRLNILINNAGTNWAAPFDKHPSEAVEKVLKVNFISAFQMTQACLPMLRKASQPNDPARVINIGSINGVSAPPDLATYGYSASKAALHHLTRHLSLHLAPEITVNAIAPGLFESKMTKVLLKQAREEIIEDTPMKRIGQPTDMASICIWLASSPGGNFVTGSVVVIDGGSVLAPRSQSSKSHL